MSNQRGDGQTYQTKKNEKNYYKNQGKYNNNFSTFEQQQKTVEPGSQQTAQSQNQMQNSQQIHTNKSQNSLLQNEYPKNIQQNSYYQFSNHQNSGKQSPATKYQPKDTQINSQAQGSNSSGVKYMQKQKNSQGQEKNNNDLKQTKNDQLNGNQLDLENLQKSNTKIENSISENIIHDGKLSEKNVEKSGQRIVEEQLNFINSNNVKFNQQPTNISNKLNNASIKDFEEIEKAAKNGNDEELQNLFDKLNKQSKQLNKRQLIQALHATVEGCKSTKNVENHIACFNYLLSFSSDQEQTINGEKNNKLIIMIAAQKGFIELVNEIIQKGAWINHVDSNSQNSLYYAIDNQQENLDVVELLIQHKANINKMTTSEGYTPLMLAVKRGHQNIVKTLMIQGAEIVIADFQSNNTALHIACELGQKEIVEILANEDTYDKIYNLSNKNDMKAKDIVEQKICYLQSQQVKDQKKLENFYEILEYLDGLKQKVDEKIDKNGNKLMHEEEKIQEDKQKRLLKKQLEKNEKQQIDVQKENESSIVKDEKSEENINQIINKKQKQKKQQINKNQQKQDQDQELKNQKTPKIEIKEANTEKMIKNEIQENEKKIVKSETQKAKQDEKLLEQKGSQNNVRGNQKLKIEKEQTTNDSKEQIQKIDEIKSKESISLEDFQQMFINQNIEQKIPLEQTQPIETSQISLSTQNVDQKLKPSEIDQNQIRDSQNIQSNAFPQQQVFPPKNVFPYQHQGKSDILQPQPLHHVPNEIVQQPAQVQINNLHSQLQNQALNFNKQQNNVNKNKAKVQPNVQNSNIYNQQQIQSPQFQNYNFGPGSMNNIQNSQQNIQNTNLQPDNLNQHFSNQQHQNQLGVITQNVNLASNLQQQMDQTNQLHALQQQLALVSLMNNGMNGVALNNLNLGFNQVLQQNQNVDHSQQNLVSQQITGGQLPVKGLQYGYNNQIMNGQTANIDQNLLQNQAQYGQQRGNNTPVNQMPGQNIINQQNINSQHNINLGEISNIQIQNGQQPFGQFQNQFSQPNQLIYAGLQNTQQQINQNMLLGQLGIANGNNAQLQNTQQQKPNMYNQQQILNIPNHQAQNTMIIPNLQDIPQNMTNNQHQNLLPGSNLTNSHIIIGNQPPLPQIQKQQKLPIKVDLDLSDEKSLNLFIYKQKYNMKKNDYFNLEKRKIELEKEISSKDNEILRLKELNRKYQLYNSLKDQGLDDSINLQKLIFHHNKQVHLITHFKEKYEKSQQFCIDLLNKSNEAIKLIKQMQSSSKEKDLHKIEDDQKPVVSNREVIDVGKNPNRKTERLSENNIERPSEEQINEIIESIQTFDELMEQTLEAKDSEEIIQKLNLNEVTLKVFNYDLVKNIIQKEHQASNILLMEKRYEIPLVKPQIPDIKKLLSAHAYALLLTQYPNFEEIHTRHNIQQIHNILHNEILLFKQDANAIMKEMAEVKQILILKVENIIKSCNSEYTIDVYGSHRTGLCMYWSDIDIVVNPVNMVFPVEALSYINDRLEREKSSLGQWITHVNYKRKATVPVVTITCSLAAIMKQENLVYPKNPCYESIYEKTISIDITCNNFQIDMHLGHRHLGIECVELVQQYVKDCWLIEPLLLVLKQLLKVNGLNEPFKGGMSSYGLLLMIVGFLQFRQYDIPCEPKHQNLGEILLDFLQYFSNFDFKNKQINCKRPDEYNQFPFIREVIQQKSLIDQIPFPYANESPTIIDPLKNDSNVTKSTYMFREIQDIFKVAHQSASVGCYCNSHFSLSGIEAQNKHSQDLQNLEYLILSLVDDPSAQAGAVCQYLQSKQTGTPSLIQYQNVGNEQDNQIHMYVQNGEEKIVPIESLYKPVFVEHSHQCDSIIAKIIYSYAQIKAARENNSRISS